MMTGLETIGYFSLGFVLTFAFMHLTWKKIRNGTKRISENKTIQK